MGDKQVGTPSVIEYETVSGVKVRVTPLQPHVFVILEKRSRELHPDPDPKPFEEAIPNAAVETAVMPAAENPEYQKLLLEALRERVKFMRGWLFKQAVTFPEGEAKIKERFDDQLQAFKDLDPELDIDDWQTVLDYCVMSPEEQNGVTLLAQAQSSVPLEGGAVVNGFKVFRPALSWHPGRRILPRK